MNKRYRRVPYGAAFPCISLRPGDAPLVISRGSHSRFIQTLEVCLPFPSELKVHEQIPAD